MSLGCAPKSIKVARKALGVGGLLVMVDDPTTVAEGVTSERLPLGDNSLPCSFKLLQSRAQNSLQLWYQLRIFSQRS